MKMENGACEKWKRNTDEEIRSEKLSCPCVGCASERASVCATAVRAGEQMALPRVRQTPPPLSGH